MFSSEDIAWLAPHVFAHRLGTGPGVEDAAQVVQESLKSPLEALSRATLKPKSGESTR